LNGAGFITGRWQQRCGLEFAFGYQVEQLRRVKGEWVPEPDMHALGLPLSEVTLATKLKAAGWKVMRCWEHDVNKRLGWCIEKVVKRAQWDLNPRHAD
jgi:hypothetical protein